MERAIQSYPSRTIHGCKSKVCARSRDRHSHTQSPFALEELTYILIDVKEGRNHGVLDLIEIRELPEHLEHAPHALAAGIVAWDIFQ